MALNEKKYHRQKGVKPETEEKYRPALELYRTTNMAVNEICAQTGTPLSPFRAYIRRSHRDLMFARYGMELSPEKAVDARLRKKSGQTAAAHAKYKQAIMACDDLAYIEFNISQIARLFGLNPSALANQLRHHYPEIQERREKERHRLGVNDNFHRGVKTWCKEQYADAVEHLRTTDDTIKQTATLYGLSTPALREYLICYHRDLVSERADKRERAKANKVRGGLTGTGGKHDPTPRSKEKYREAIHLYRTTAMTQKEISAATGVSVMGLRNYLRAWNQDLVEEHRDVDRRKESNPSFVLKRYLKSTAAKYADAIKQLKATGRATAEVAREFGLNPETFREYLYEHEPELSASLGMKRLANGRLVLARSAEKYEQAVRLYETTTEPLKSIACRLGIQYNSIFGFVRRNYPDVIATHNRLVKEAEKRKREEEAAEAIRLAQEKEAQEKERILDALRQTGGHRRNAAKLLGISKSTLYNKLNAFKIE